MYSSINYIYLFTLGFVSGVMTHAYARSVSFWSIILVLLLAIGVASFSFLIRGRSNTRYQSVLISVLLFILAFVCGWFRLYVHDIASKHHPLDAYLDQRVTLIGDVAELKGEGFLFSVRTVMLGSRIEHISPETIVVNKVSGSFAYRDVVALSAILKQPENFKLKDGSLFDNVSYLERQNIYHVVSFPTLLEQKKQDNITLRSMLVYLKDMFVRNVVNVIPEPESSLALGTTIAGKGALPQDVKTDFVKAGLIHIVVLSGYNIAIVTRFFILMLHFTSRRMRVLCALGGVALFVLMVGPSAPVVRSAIMACITLLGTLSYTKVSQNKVLFGAVLVMTIWSPFIILGDASFMLSVLATFAIINYADVINSRISFVTDRFGLRQILAETLGTQIFVLPYLLYEIGNLSLVAPLSNIIVLPCIPIVMLLTFAVALVSPIPIIHIPLSVLLIFVSRGVIEITHLFARIPYGYFQIDRLPLSVTLVLYAVLLGILYLARRQKVVASWGKESMI